MNLSLECCEWGILQGRGASCSKSGRARRHTQEGMKWPSGSARGLGQAAVLLTRPSAVEGASFWEAASDYRRGGLLLWGTTRDARPAVMGLPKTERW
jgi:hypothetical protein